MQKAKADASGIPVWCDHSKIEQVSALKPFPKNPNKHSAKQIQLLAGIIKAQGWRNPIVVSTLSGFITKGHARLAAAQHLKVASVPVDFQHYASKDAEYADIIADNKIAELATPDKDMLRELIGDMDEQFRQLTGFVESELKQMFATEENVGALLNVLKSTMAPPKVKVERGDTWQVGPHLLFCCDPFTEWREYMAFLKEDTDLFCPFAGVFSALGTRSGYKRFIMVQPNTYICGHIIESYAKAEGKNRVCKL